MKVSLLVCLLVFCLVSINAIGQTYTKVKLVNNKVQKTLLLKYISDSENKLQASSGNSVLYLEVTTDTDGNLNWVISTVKEKDYASIPLTYNFSIFKNYLIIVKPVTLIKSLYLNSDSVKLIYPKINNSYFKFLKEHGLIKKSKNEIVYGNSWNSERFIFKKNGDVTTLISI